MTIVAEVPNGLSAVSAETVLASHFTLVSVAGAVETIVVEGAEGWTSPNPHPALSLMRWTTRDKVVAARALDEVLDRFRKEGRGFDWMIGPQCAQSDLLSLLKSRGFIDPPLEVAAMVKTIKSDIPKNSVEGLHIWKVDDPADGGLDSIMARGFDVPDDVGAIFHQAYMTASPLQRSEVYAAAIGDDDEPVGVGYSSYIGDGPSVLLRVSSTLGAYRKRGVYRALVTRRLYEAAQQGRTQAFVHAYSPASCRSLKTLGFSTVGKLQLHRWRP